MLIRTYGELDALPDDSCVIDNQGLVHQKHDGQWRTWVEYGKIAHSDFPLTLIHPRRYGDEERQRAIEAGMAAIGYTLNLNDADRYMESDHEKAISAALNALRTGNIPPETATGPHTTAHKGTNRQNTADEGARTTDQEMQQLAESATEGPWEAEDCEGEFFVGADDALTQWEETSDGFRIGTPASSWKSTNRIYEHDLDTWDAGEDKDDDQRRADAEFIAACREWVPGALRWLEAVRELQAKIARHAQQDREEGRPAAALLTQIANDLNRALEGK